MISKTAEYRAWQGMISRCLRPRATSWRDYGGRGVTVSEEWLRRGSGFAAFLRHVGARPSARHSLDRIDNNGNYEPGNVRWATRFEQSRNRSNNRWIDYRGERRCLTDWAVQFGIAPGIVSRRLRDGMSVEAALMTPKCPRGGRRTAGMRVVPPSRQPGHSQPGTNDAYKLGKTLDVPLDVVASWFRPEVTPETPSL